ncbi:DUF4190 domain-containing protein [Geodermatophilus sp. DSM 45219]|uniref:DUF4190 domain-containing protein n=1 Tax=Geodermatophilus sp. DSM 45219 TaxID=1881103 RepID=UPI0008838343|nr:DUF4190 domain-containing protein [Geodermatophilus sp. DSM 45219]SDO72346.1 protein of unknown function [Geodermatophilus sp. DSM 45219]
MTPPVQAPYQPYPPFQPEPPRKGSGLAIASMVLGIIALLLSWIPIVNYLAAVLAVVALGLGIPALLRARRGVAGGRGLAITGLVTSVVALVLVVVTQLLFSAVIDEVERSLDEETGSAAAPELAQPATEGEAAPAAEVVPLGTPARVGDYEVTVDSVELDANASVAAANEFNEAPAGQYVVTQLTVTYTGTEEGMPGWDLSAVFHGSDARQYSDAECMAVLADDALDAPTLNPGGTDTFQFCMDVPAQAIAGGQLSVEPTVSFDSDERVFYAVQ